MIRTVPLALCIGLALAAASAAAQEIDAVPLGEAELADARAGILLPTGIEANFGALVSTFSDGQLLLQTQVTWEADGLRTQQLIGSDLLTPSDAVPGGLVLQGADGATLFAHQVGEDGLRNVLVNTASGRDIRVDTQLRITLPEFSLTQQGMRDSLLALHLTDDLAAAPN
jgi:hypothetical protein